MQSGDSPIQHAGEGGGSPQSSHSSEAIRVASELVALLVRGLDDDVHSAIDVIKVITKMAYTAKKRQIASIHKAEAAAISARSVGPDSARTALPPKEEENNSHNEEVPQQNDEDDDDDDDYGVSSSTVIVNEQDWGHAGLYHNLLQGVIVRASKFAVPSNHHHHGGGGPQDQSLLTTPSRSASVPAASPPSDIEEDPRASARSLVDLVEHTAQMFLAMSDAFHPMVAKLIVELCFEYISNVESIACAHPWLFMLLGPIVVGLPTDAAAWDASLIDLAVARHPKVVGSSAAVRLLRNPAVLVQELRFALARFLATYVASERMLEGLSTQQASLPVALLDGEANNVSGLGSPSVVAPSGTSPLLMLSRTPNTASAAAAPGVALPSDAKVERLSLLALEREAERAAADRRRDRSPENNANGKNGPPPVGAAATGALSPLSQTTLELHNLHTSHLRGGGSMTAGGILVPRLDIPRIFKNRGGTNEHTAGGGGVLDASPVRPPHHQHNVQHFLADGGHHHHLPTAISGTSSAVSPSMLTRQSIDFLGPHVGDSLMRQYGIADHMKLRWKQQQHQQQSRSRQQQQHHRQQESRDVSWTQRDGDVGATEDPFHLQQLVVCGHKLGQLFGTVDAKMLLRLKKDHEALVAAHELEASSSAYYTTQPSSLGMSQVLSGSMAHREGLATTLNMSTTAAGGGLGNSMALRLSLGRGSVGRDDFQLPAAFDEWSRSGLASWITFGMERIGSAFVPLPQCSGDSITTASTTPTPVRGLDGGGCAKSWSDGAVSSGAIAAKLVFRELAMIVLQGLAGHDSSHPTAILSRMVSSVGSPFTPHRTHGARSPQHNRLIGGVLPGGGTSGPMLLPASLAQQQQLNQSLSSPNNNGGGSALLFFFSLAE
ncbi:Hypothetical protein, putative, partial [Bodo saltans]